MAYNGQQMADCRILEIGTIQILDQMFYFRSISTLKGELLPYMVKKQFSKPKVLPQANASVLSTDTKTGIVLVKQIDAKIGTVMLGVSKSIEVIHWNYIQCLPG